jgi:UDP-glucose 4-epimerase
MRVLVTGGLGYVGGVVAARLVETGNDVTVLTRGSRTTPVPPDGVAVVEGELLDHEGLAKLVLAGEFDGVCHLAALARIRESYADPLGYFDVNLVGTINLLRALAELAQQTGAPPRLVFASAGAVYSPAAPQPTPEDALAVPASPYGASKLAAEQAIGYQAATGALGAVSLRCWGIAGAVGRYGDDDRSRLLPKALAVAAGQERSLAVNGDGTAVRELTHVADVAEAYRLALAAVRPGIHQVFNVGSGVGVAIREVIATVEEVTGRAVRIERRPAQPEPQVLVLDSQRIRRDLAWHPQQSELRKMVQDGWMWLRAQGQYRR